MLCPVEMRMPSLEESFVGLPSLRAVDREEETRGLHPGDREGGDVVEARAAVKENDIGLEGFLEPLDQIVESIAEREGSTLVAEAELGIGAGQLGQVGIA